jgi:outer membrane receptor protein involved in Fe transport
MTRFTRAITLVLGVCVLGGYGRLHAQVTTATVYGLAADSTGAALPGAAVTLTNESTAAVTTARSDGRGEFMLTFVPVGRYTLKVTLDGFADYVQEGLTLSAGQSVRLSIPLQIGAMTDTLTVSGATPLINRANAQQQSVVVAQQLQELPLGQRNWARTVELDTSAVLAGQGGVSMNGLPPAALNLTIDGTNGSSDAELPSVSVYQGFSTINGVSTEAVEQISISKGIASAEFGGTMAGNVNIITRGGTNAFHGSLFENHQQDELDARNPFVATRPDKTFDQFGGSIGGPVVRSRLFFFGAYEGVRSRQDKVLRGNVPTPEWRAEALSRNPVYKPFFDLFPDPTDPYQASALTARATLTRAESRDDHNVTARGDINLSNTDRIVGRYTRGRPERVDPRLVEANARVYAGMQDSATVSFTHAADGWVSETRAGVNRTNIDRVDQLYVLGGPNINVQGFDASGGESFVKRGVLFSVDEVVALTRGRHAIKAGVNLLRQSTGRSNFQTPDYRYSSTADFYANIPSQVQFTFGLDDFRLRASQIGGFVQDDVRIGATLVLNAGVRYDYFTVPSERDGRLFNRDDPWGTGPLRPADRIYEPDFNNVSPRLGFAWTPAQNTVVRGGAGVFINPHTLFAGPVDLVLNAPDQQFRVTASRQDAIRYGIAYPMGTEAAEAIVQGPASLWGTASIAPDFPNPSSVQWSIIAEQQIGSTYSVEAGYIGNRSDHLMTVRRINQPDRLTGVRPTDGFSEFRYFDATNRGTYHSLQVKLNRRFSGRLSFGASYTLGKSMSYGNGDLELVNPLQDSYDLAAEYGPSNWDVRHRFVAHFVYEVPPAGAHPAVRALVGGWQVSGILAARSGQPQNITDGASNYASSRPDYLGAEMVAPNWKDTLFYFNAAAFARVPIASASGAQIRPGTLGWNAARGPSSTNLDLGLARNVRISQWRLQVRADLFNALNTRNYGNPSTRIDAANFGQITSVSTRTMQIGAKLTF